MHDPPEKTLGTQIIGSFLCLAGKLRTQFVTPETPDTSGRKITDMKILICNDDGYQASGIIALYEALRDIADVEVVAPEQNNSA